MYVFIEPRKEFRRIGCLAAVKAKRDPMSLRRLKDPMNEFLLRLRMEGTYVSDEKELEELIQRVNDGQKCFTNFRLIANNLLLLTRNFMYKAFGSILTHTLLKPKVISFCHR